MSTIEEKFKIKSVEKISTKPVLSIGNYESLDAECIIAGSSDKNIRFLEIGTLDEIAKCKVNKKSVSFVAVSEMGLEGEEPIIVTGGKDSSVQIWDPIEGCLQKNIQLPINEVRSIAIYQGTETYLVVGSKDSKVIVWDVKKDKKVVIFEGHKASVHCVSITTSATDLETQCDLDCLCIASGGADRTARTWDITTGKKKNKFRHKRSISTMVVANNGIRPILATGGVERVIKLWDIDTGVLLRSMDGHLDQINSLCLWEGYEMLIISASSDRTLRVYDILSGECLCVLVGHTDSVLSVSIANKDDPVVVSSSDDLSLVQWSLTDIICQFFFTDDDNLGTRNDEPPYLPIIEYVAPPELDKTVLTKEERKRIRKEAKRLKRLKAKALFHGTSAEELEDDDNEYEYEEEEEEEDNEEEEQDNEEEEQQMSIKDHGQVSSPSPPPPSSSSSSSLVRSFSNKVLPLSPDGQIPTDNNKSITGVSVVTNALSKVLGLGSAAEVGIESSSSSSSTVVKKLGGKTYSGTTTTGLGKERESLRQQANATTNKYNMALVQKELDADRLKSKAAEKLAMRLSMKKNGLSISLEGQGGVDNNNDNNKETEELVALKAEKLKQHKLQESRRKQSMFMAKDRAKGTLQKRLDEIAMKKKRDQETGLGTFLEDDDDDEDSDDDNDSGDGQ